MATAERATVGYGDGATANSTSLIFAIPSAAGAGDYAAVTFASGTQGVTITPPSGWTLVSGPDNTSTTISCWLYEKTLTAFDPGTSATFGVSASIRTIGEMVIVSGGDPTTRTFGKTVAAGSETSTTVPSITGTAGGILVVLAPRRAGSGSAPTVTIPAGYTDDGDRVATAFTSGAQFSAVSMHKAIASAGTVGGDAVTVTASSGAIYAIAVPAAATTSRSGLMKVWSGSAWVQHPVKVWTGSAWAIHPAKGFDSTSWVTAK